MATVLKKAYTMPTPPGAEFFDRDGVRMARWKLRNGERREAEVVPGSGDQRVRGQSEFFTARYRDGAGKVVEVSTDCREETAARQVLADLIKRAERVRSGMVTSAEDQVVDHRRASIETHVAAYLKHLSNKKVNGRRVSEHHVVNVEHNLRRVIRECKFVRLSDLSRKSLERWMDQREGDGLSARTRNAHLAAIVAFGNWSVETHRITSSPFNRLQKANEKMDRRRQRRALTEEELTRLLDMARRRPLLDAMLVRRGKRKGQAVARVTDENRRALEHLGLERALIYKVLVLTGLRCGELRSLTIGQLEFNPDPDGMSYVVLKAQDEKNGQGSDIPLRNDLVADLTRWLALQLERTQERARRDRRAVPNRLPPETPLFTVPTGLIRIFDLDLVAAGLAKRVMRNGKWVIDKRDDRGRSLDVHALRHTFGTHLSKGGVAPRTAQAAMRHSTLELTMQTYTDPRLLDVAGALNVLPDLPLSDTKAQAELRPAGAQLSASAKMVVGLEAEIAGARSASENHLALNLALPADRSGPSVSSAGQRNGKNGHAERVRERVATSARDKTSPPLSPPDLPRHSKRATRLERATISLEG